MDAPQARAGADWMCLVFAADALMTHAGTVSMALIVNAFDVGGSDDLCGN